MTDLLDRGEPVTVAREVPPPRDVSFWWYALAFVVYVALALGSLALRDNVLLLNWIVGPLVPVFVLFVIPSSVRALARWTAHR